MCTINRDRENKRSKAKHENHFHFLRIIVRSPGNDFPMFSMKGEIACKMIFLFSVYTGVFRNRVTLDADFYVWSALIRDGGT